MISSMTLAAETLKSARAATREIFEPPKLSLDRAPVLFAVFEKMAELLGEGMRSFCAPRYTFKIEAVTMGDASELVSDYSNGLCGVFRCPEWDACVLIGVDRGFTHASMDALFGGDGTEAPDLSRPISAIEKRTLRQLLELTAGRFEASFRPIEAITVEFERIETKIDVSTIGSDTSVVARLAATVQSVTGSLFIVVPQSALASHHKRLQREPAQTVGVQDPQWTRNLLAEIGRTDIKLEVVLPGPFLSLQSLSELRPGQIMPLPATRESLVELECSGKPVFRCKLAQSEGRFAVALEERVDEQRELIGDLLAPAGAGGNWS